MRNLLISITLFLVLICMSMSVEDQKYEIKLNEKISHLKKCVGTKGHLQHDERYDVFIIDVNQPLCLDLLRNSAQQFIFVEAPTHFDIYIPAVNNVTLKCNSKFTLTKESDHVTKLEVICIN